MLTLEEIIKQLDDRNLSEVGRRLGLTRAYLSAVVNGRFKPGYENLKKLSDYLGGGSADA